MTTSERGDTLALNADYLVIGAGLHSLAFVDELIVQDAEATAIIVDSQPRPGGHWNFAYPFCTLHQHTCTYGVNSEPLGLHVDPSTGFEPFDIKDLAGTERLLGYFARVMTKLEATGRVRYFPSATYDFAERAFAASDGARHTVTYRKLVTTTSNVTVPAMGPPKFPVGAGVNLKPVNVLASKAEAAFTRPAYVVIGGGKTASDAVVHLLKHGVPVASLTWIIPRDMWYFLRECIAGPGVILDSFSFLMSAAKGAVDASSMMLDLEKARIVGRLDAHGPRPTVFKGATISTAELEVLRSVHRAGRIVRLGRVTAIDAESITLERGSVAMPSAAEALVVDCSAGGISGYVGVNQPFGADYIKLTGCFFFNVSLAGATFAWLEANVKANEDGSADERKNASVYGAVPGMMTFDAPGLVNFLYSDQKMMESLMALGAGAWVQQARTSLVSLKHMPMLKLLWTAFGPAQLLANGKAFMEKVERGGFADAYFFPQWKANIEAAKQAEAAKKARKAALREKRRAALLAALSRCLPCAR